MSKTILKAAVVLVLVALVWKVVSGGEGEPVEVES
jgi:hypothetical protein